MNSEYPLPPSQGDINKLVYKKVSSHAEKRRVTVSNPYIKSNKSQKTSSILSPRIKNSESTSFQTFVVPSGKFTVSKSNNCNSESHTDEHWNNVKQTIARHKYPPNHTNRNQSLHQNLQSNFESATNTSSVSSEISYHSLPLSKNVLGKNLTKPKILNPYSRPPRQLDEYTSMDSVDASKIKKYVMKEMNDSSSGKKELLSENNYKKLQKFQNRNHCSKALNTIHWNGHDSKAIDSLLDEKKSVSSLSSTMIRIAPKPTYNATRKNPYLKSNSIKNTKILSQNQSIGVRNHQMKEIKSNYLELDGNNYSKEIRNVATNHCKESSENNYAATTENQDHFDENIDWESIDLKSTEAKTSPLSFKKVNKTLHNNKTKSCSVMQNHKKNNVAFSKNGSFSLKNTGGKEAEDPKVIKNENCTNKNIAAKNAIVILDNDDRYELPSSVYVLESGKVKLPQNEQFLQSHSLKRERSEVGAFKHDIQKKISKFKLQQDYELNFSDNWSKKSALSSNGFAFPDPCTRGKYQTEQPKSHEKLDEIVKSTSIRTENQLKTSKASKTNQTIPSKSAETTTSTNCENLSRLPSLPRELIYDDKRIAAIDDDYKKELIKNANLSGTLENGWKLLPHQKQGVLRALLMRRLVLAFDMGLGKTLIACVWAKAFQKTFEHLNVYIVTPVSLKNEWEKTAREATGLRVGSHGEALKKKKQKRNLNVKDRISQSIESKLIDSQSDNSEYDLNTKMMPDIQICSWAKIPINVSKEIDHYVVICDEAHSMQNMESSRTKNALKLIHDKRCIGVLLLTGTPMKNGKPSNLFPLLKAVRHPFGDDQKRYEIFFCNGQQRQVGPTNKCIWDASGSSNLGVLNAHISSHVFHKTKDSCLKELPSKSRVYKKVPISSRYELKYTNALNQFAKIQNSDFENKQCKTEVMLEFISKIRLIAAFSKVDATVALSKTILRKESSIVIFTNFVQVAKEIHNKLGSEGWGGELLTGETPPAKRQSMVNKFQQGISPVFICTYGVGGVGLTLTAACTIILVDRPWTPGDTLQAEDRVRRIGQTRPVKSIWMRALDFDEKLDDMLEHKNKNSKAVVDDYNDNGANNYNESKSQPKVPIFELMNAVVSSNSLSKTTNELNLNKGKQEHAGFFTKEISPD